MLRLRFAPLSMTGADARVVMLSEAKHLIPRYCRVLRPMPMLTAVLLFFGCRADPLEAALAAEASTSMYGNECPQGLGGVSGVARAALGKDWSCSDKYRLSIASA